MKGVRIAKPGYDVGDPSERLYVDTDTPLNKVAQIISGSMTFDGSSFTPLSYEGYTPSVSALVADQRLYLLVIPHDLDYVPTFLLYCDTNPYADRLLVTSYAVELGANFIPNVFVTDSAIELSLLGGRLDSGPGVYLPPEAGKYSYYGYIFYDDLEA